MSIAGSPTFTLNERLWFAPGGVGQNNGTFASVGARAYYCYIMTVPETFTPLYVFGQTRGTVASGSQVAEMGLYSTPLVPNGAGQTLTRIEATGTITALTANGPIRNTTAFATSVAAGTHLWAAFRGDMSGTEPSWTSYIGDAGLGYILIESSATALTGGSATRSGTVPAIALWTGATAGLSPVLAIAMDP